MRLIAVLPLLLAASWAPGGALALPVVSGAAGVGGGEEVQPASPAAGPGHPAAAGGATLTQAPVDREEAAAAGLSGKDAREQQQQQQTTATGNSEEAAAAKDGGKQGEQSPSQNQNPNQQEVWACVQPRLPDCKTKNLTPGPAFSVVKWRECVYYAYNHVCHGNSPVIKTINAVLDELANFIHHSDV